MILGSTGSIGRQAIEVVQEHRQEFNVIALVAGSNIEAIIEQAQQLSPAFICLVDESAAAGLKSAYEGPAKVLGGDGGLLEVCSLSEADLILNAIVGAAGLKATLASLENHKTLALSNKESLVAAGALVREALSKSDGRILPVDSEHNALFQCLVGEKSDEVARLILTASGGPFWGCSEDELKNVTPAQALDHPRWRMGPRVTIDSATLMNKGFEVIEAHWLFDLPFNQIDVIIHPQSIVHSLVEFIDGSMKAHLGPTDMRLPILYSFSWPKRLSSGLAGLDLGEIGKLEFFRADLNRAKCLGLAFESARLGRSYPTVLNGADEVVVENFLSGRVRFNEIGDIIDNVLEAHEPIDIASLSDFESADAWARARAELVISKRVVL